MREFYVSAFWTVFLKRVKIIMAAGMLWPGTELFSRSYSEYK